MSDVPQEPPAEDSDTTDWWAPLWKRMTAVVLILCWMVIEWKNGSQLFFALAGVGLVLTIYEFFIVNRESD